MATQRLILGDCVEVMRGFPSESFDAVVSDPPAGIFMMGAKWDHDKGGRRQWVAWMTEVFTEVYRVMKPGAHGLVWALPRTSHWTAWALEDAGFEIRDKILHLFGSGFPKSLDVSKAIDKAAGAERERVRPVSRPSGNGDGTHALGGSWQDDPWESAPATDAARQWEGWGTALKPSYEDWWLIRKPLAGSVAANVLQYGCGAINIDASRIRSDDAGSQGSSGQAGTRECPVHTVRGMRDADATVALTGQPGEVADDLQQAVPSRQDAGQREFELARRVLDGQPLRIPHGRSRPSAAGGSGAPAIPGAEGVSGASPRDGSKTREAAPVGRVGSSRERDQGRQPSGESASDGLGWTFPRAPLDRAGALQPQSAEPSPPRCSCPPDGVAAGRWPANCVLSHEPADEHGNGGCREVGTKRVKGSSHPQTPTHSSNAAFGGGRYDNSSCYGDSAGAETVPSWICEPNCAVRLLDEQAGERKSGSYSGQRKASKFQNAYGTFNGTSAEQGHEGSIGGASRFYFCAKASPSERGEYNDWPTVKNLALMRWLVTLVAAPGGQILDPFCGSGSTLIAADQLGFDCTGIDQDAHAIAISKRRLYEDSPLFSDIEVFE